MRPSPDPPGSARTAPDGRPWCVTGAPVVFLSLLPDPRNPHETPAPISSTCARFAPVQGTIAAIETGSVALLPRAPPIEAGAGPRVGLSVAGWRMAWHVRGRATRLEPARDLAAGR